MKKILLLFAVSLFAFDVTYELNNGWNMISLPCIPEGENLSDILPFVPPAYSYNPETMGYTALEGLPEPTEGLWLLVDGDTTVTIGCTTHWPSEPEPVVVDTNYFLAVRPPIAGLSALFCATDSGFLMASLFSGPDTSTASSDNGGIVYMNTNGVPVWGKRLSTGRIDELIGLSDGGFFIAGEASGTSGGTCIMRLDRDGGLVWAKTFASSTVSGGLTACQLGDGGIILAQGTFLMKIDLSGDIVWSKNMTNEIMALEGKSDDTFFASFVSASTTSGSAAIIADMNSVGTAMLSRNYYSDEYIDFNLFAVGPDSTFYVIGQGGSTTLDVSIILLAVNPAMTINWSRAIVIEDIWDAAIEDIDFDSEGNIVLAGSRETDPLLISLDAEGELLWAQTYIGELIGPDDPESAFFLHAGEEGLNVFGTKRYCSMDNYALSFKTESDGTNCLSMEADVVVEDAVLGLSSESISSTPETITTSDLDVTITDMEVGRIDFCR